jgi:hypothetical protein
LVLSLAVGTQAQSGYKKLSHPDVNKSVKTSLRNLKEAPVAEMEFTPSTAIVSSVTNRGTNGVSDAHVMTTIFDIQSNSSLSNRLVAFPDGTVAATAMRGVEAPITTTGFPDRGTGYNYYNGSSWGTLPTARIEPFRSGWPSIAPLGANGEFLVSHGGTPFGIYAYSRENKGTGDWTALGILAGMPSPWEAAWPRVASTGEDHQVIHVIAGDQDTAPTIPINQVFYNRSEDGGQNWQGWAAPPEVDVDFYNYNIGADDYSMAANGNTVAVLFASAWYDLFFIKSTDNGANWTKTVVWEHPYPSFDFETTFTTDTLWTCDNSANIAIDNNGMVHIVWGTQRVMHEAAGASYNYFPYTDGIGYWNESMGPIPTNPANPHKTLDPDYLESLGKGMVAGYCPDINNNGQIDIEASGILTYRTLGISTQPSISIDNNGSIAIFYSTLDETRMIEELNYRSLYATYKDGIFGTWYYATENVSGGIFHLFEEVYSSTSAPIGYDGTFYAMYSADNLVGLALDEDHVFQDNKIYVAKVTPVIIGVNEQINPVTEISAVYPNPVSSNMNVDVNLSKSAKNAKVEVHTITGQRVYTETLNSLSTGLNKVKIDASSFNTGVYFFTLTIDGYKETKKFVVN